MAQFRDTLREVLLYLRQYKARTLMTMFGLIWGTLTVVFLLSFGVGVEKSMKKNMHGMGEGIAILWPGTTTKVFKGYNRGRSIRFRPDDVEYLRTQVRAFKAISPEYINYNTPVRVGETVNKTAITGITPEYGPMRNVIAQKGGRWLNQPDLDERRRVAFIGYELRDLLFGKGADAVNKQIYIYDTPFLVIGVLKEKTQPSSYGVRDHSRVFIPITTHESLLGRRYLNDIVYQVKDPTRSKQVQDKNL
ncbi:MAG: ABC transporter permease [candidate division KSB1 bacterium]|nr:ABC transporter permease [candidate division KSB1 bacterium]